MTSPDRKANSELTDERVAILVEFADNVAAGRRLMKWLAWMGAVATALAALAYYVLGVWNGWHSVDLGRH